MIIRSRFCFVLILALGFGSPVLAAPTWYVSGGTGNQIDPTLPDFYQHQNLATTGTNAGTSQGGWENNGTADVGWCFWTAYTDAFYDLTTQGYTGLLAASPTGAGWYSAIYGATPATSSTSDISKLVAAMPNNASIQGYLTATTSAATAPLLSNTFTVNVSGNVMYTNSFGSLAMAGSSSDVFSFTNSVIKNLSGEVLYNLGPGTTPAFKSNANGDMQGRWWTFHYVTVAGLNLSSSTSFIADPDTNVNPATMDGSGSSAMGWPTSTNAASVGFPFSSSSSSALPVITNYPTATNHFADFSFTGNKISSTASPQYNGAVVSKINVVYPTVVVKTSASAAPGGGVKTDITLSLPASSNPVDGIFIEPSSLTDSSSGSPGLFSFTDNSSGTVSFSSSASSSAGDPFGNALLDGGALYLSNSGDFMPGQTADVDLGTAANFLPGGYDVLLHFQGDPPGVWLPEMFGGTNFNPSDIAEVQTVVPEPGSAALLVAGCGALGLLTHARRRRTLALRSSTTMTFSGLGPI